MSGRQVRGRPVVNISSFSEHELTERREIEQLARAVPQLDHYAALGVEPLGGTPAQFGAYIQSEIGKWGKVVKQAGLKPE